uniref:Uncharacterized protein LOC111132064 n=1 Tax=Crassostrea virginica TaxID=6565 RepID=A0A8B8E7J8_CRAVI|nr:uncharacterized protein LOC111132064 [Crassostrea virginica]
MFPERIFLTGALLLLCNSVHGFTSKLLTYNTFLITSSQGYEKRTAHIANNIDSTGADIICLQEVWEERDVKAIVNANKENYPFTFSGLHSDTHALLASTSSRPRCVEPQVFRVLFRGLINGCFSNEGTYISNLQCLLDKAEYFDLSRQCISCLTLTGFEYGTLLKNCFLSKSKSNLPGLLLLSKRILIDPKLTYFEPEKTIFNRAYISFKDEYAGDIRCTHQTAEFKDGYLEKNLMTKYGSWEKQNFDETMELVKSFSNHVGPEIILGDLNTGPFTPIQGNEGYFMDSYNFYKNSGFMPSLDSVCTFCLENPLADDDVNSLIDHVLVRFSPTQYRRTAERVFQDRLPGENFPPSDHYGVQLTLEEL